MKNLKEKFSVKLFVLHIPLTLFVSFLFWSFWKYDFWICFLMVEGGFAANALLMVCGDSERGS